MRLRRYCVTVMDNWTPTRFFWTYLGAEAWWSTRVEYAYIYKWEDGDWRKL